MVKGLQRKDVTPPTFSSVFGEGAALSWRLVTYNGTGYTDLQSLETTSSPTTQETGRPALDGLVHSAGRYWGGPS